MLAKNFYSLLSARATSVDEIENILNTMNLQRNRQRRRQMAIKRTFAESKSFNCFLNLSIHFFLWSKTIWNTLKKYENNTKKWHKKKVANSCINLWNTCWFPKCLSTNFYWSRAGFKNLSMPKIKCFQFLLPAFDKKSRNWIILDFIVFEVNDSLKSKCQWLTKHK